MLEVKLQNIMFTKAAFTERKLSETKNSHRFLKYITLVGAKSKIGEIEQPSFCEILI